MSGVSVLMYHALESAEYPAGAKDAGEQRYVLQVEQFRVQLEYLHNEGFRTFLLQELLDLEEWPDKSVVLTFDDGHESNFALALPLLQMYAFNAEFFITTDWIGTPHFMTVEQVKALHDAGMGIGSHGLSHKFLDDMNSSEIERELHKSKNILTGITGQKVTSFSAPGGRMRRGVADIAEDIGFRIVCTSQPGVLNQRSFFYSIPRLVVRADTDLETFKTMVRGDHEYVAKLARRNSFMFIAKKVLGNKGYERMRKMMLRII
jgi:peptidoglycan/xylan/chitin deacetylase (PgdA/CDA1 family)